MYERKIPHDLRCGLDLTREVMSGKWKPSLLYHIARGTKRPSDLQRQIPNATRRVLDLQLGQLEQHELITKMQYPQLPPKVEYTITALGESLLPVILAMGCWGDEHQAALQRVTTKTYPPAPAVEPG